MCTRGLPFNPLWFLVLIIAMIVLFTLLPGNNAAPKSSEVHFLDQNGEFYAISVTPRPGGCYEIIGKDYWAMETGNCSLEQSKSGIYCGQLEILEPRANDICTQ
jgi:hypothetical protein